MINNKQYSISAFFPCYNDKGTIASMVLETKSVLEKLTNDYEIIVIDDGSSDGSRDLLLKLQHDISQLKLVFHDQNKGYGGALRSGFKTATKDLVFYTDGDAQYDVKELPLLLEKLTDNIDVVNGYKIKRSDPWHRIVIGSIYQAVMKLVFWLPIKDPDCDFRIIRRHVFDKINLHSNTGTICVELVKKIQLAGFKFAETGVHHYFRTYGKSQFFNFKRVFKTLWQLAFLWWELMVFSKKSSTSKRNIKLPDVKITPVKSLCDNGASPVKLLRDNGANKKTKIILVNSPLSASEQAGSLEKVANIIMPLGIGYVAAVLKKAGFSVELIDCVPLQLNKEKLGEILKEKKPDIIAFTATIISIGHAIETVKYLKNILSPETIFVMGGPHITSLPKKTMEHGCFDFGIIGEGEYVFLEFVNMIENGDNDFGKVKSLVWKNNNEIIVNPRRELITNLDELPFPARELYPPLEHYHPMPGGYKRLPFGHMVTSRGCPFQCVFCDRSVFGQKFRARSAKNVVNEIEHLVENYGIKEIKFYDDLFTFSKQRVIEICDEILRRKIDITWSCSSRVSTVDLELLKKMKSAGLWQIDYGLESGNQEVLNKMKKGITLEQSEQAVRWAKKLGIKARAFIIIGMPGETKESIDDTINFVKRIPLDVVAFYAVMIYPGNELYNIVKAEGKLLHEDFSQFSSLIDVDKSRLHYVPDGLTEEYIRKSISRAMKEFYLRPSYLLRQVLSIRSWVDIKRYWAGFRTIIKI